MGIERLQCRRGKRRTTRIPKAFQVPIRPGVLLLWLLVDRSYFWVETSTEVHCCPN